MSPGAEHGDVDDEPASTLTWASALVLDVGVGERLLGSQKWGSEWGWAKSSEPPSRGVATKECLSISSIYPGNSPKNQHNIAHFPQSLVEPMVSVEDRLPHAAASSFALVIHLISRLLPMPLAVDDAQWPKACFWAGDQARRRRKFRSGGACSTDFKHFSIRCGSEHGEQDMFFLAISCNFGSFLSDDNDEKPDLTRFNHLIFLGLKDLTI